MGFEELAAIPINPGGIVDPTNIVGREEEIGAILGDLARGSGVHQPGERRHGKTSVSRAVQVRARERGWTVVQRSVEGMRTTDAVLEALTTGLTDQLPSMTRARAWLKSSTDVKVGGVSVRPEPMTLDDVVVEACDHAPRVLLILDELPICARALEQTEPGAGLAFLHSLRRMRQDNPKLTMLCLGSIGFHHVVPSLQGALNDLQKRALHPLAEAGARELSARLLKSTDIPLDIRRDLAEPMARLSEGVPFYLHHLADGCDRRACRGEPLSGDDVTLMVDDAIADPDDPWDLKHYVTRLPDYYGAEAPAAAAILDHIAQTPSDRRAIEIGLAAQSDEIAGADALDLLGRLEQDHYLVNEAGRRRFRSELVRRAWQRWRT